MPPLSPTPRPFFVNPHLEGGSFFWEGGSTGVILTHGYTATTAEVRPLAQVLHQNGYTVAGALLPGHGTTPEDANRCRWQDWVAACEKTYRQLSERCERVFIAGESMGGLLSLHLAANHPEAAGVMLYAPALRIPSTLMPLVAPLIARFRTILPKGDSTPSAADARWQGYNVHPTHATTQLFALQRATYPLLANIRQPLLIIQGKLDTTVHAGVPEIIASRVRSTVKEIHWMDKTGHCVILDEEWEQAAALTLAFIKAHA
jgi:carboxylesterase